MNLQYKVLDNSSDRWVEIYKIINNVNNKIYVGQAVSHIKKHNKYVPHGMVGRFKTHLSEAKINATKNACVNLNNALNKYGYENFKLELIKCCSIDDANLIESQEIVNNNSLSPNGYNLTTSCKSVFPSQEFCEKISDSIINYHVEKRISNLNLLSLKDITNVESVVRPRFQHGKHIGWFIRLKDILIDGDLKKTFDFESRILSLDENKKRAIEFMNILINRSNTSKLRENLKDETV